ncbi:hypothetical protein IEZ26_02835 [Nocardioides cavernae]|uniref:Uncharacterized protein n=1 Tax=Nocardioides cavernae TaxID=1921566 RepID=A0ABR8N8I3_9ACTN|nr:hypothetical protein [Nocardioides cavernae]MBD3923541.1 hypothetical protein [Nocardioides cavernae]MBM7511530.1 hypothetical protein [Nocardioides cavernae]
MNNSAIDATARIATFHRADVAREVAAARTARRTRQPVEPVVTEVPSRRRNGWSRWLPAPRPAH